MTDGEAEGGRVTKKGNCNLMGSINRKGVLKVFR